MYVWKWADTGGEKNCFYTERQGKKVLLIHGNHAKGMNKNVIV